MRSLRAGAGDKLAALEMRQDRVAYIVFEKEERVVSKKRAGVQSVKKGVRTKLVKKTVRRKAASKSAPYNPQTGQLARREIKAQERLEARAAQLQSAEGLSPQEAKQRAREEMRSHHGRRDWRHG